jgi:hypothetical protein
MLGAPGETDPGKRLVCEYGLAMANAELDWLDSTLSQLREELLPEEDIETVCV